MVLAGHRSVGAVGPEAIGEVGAVGVCMCSGGSPGLGPEELQHVEVSERRSTQKTDKTDGRGDKLPMINHASATGLQM